MEMEGIKAELFTSGKFKGMGVPGVAMTKEQKQFLQDRVDGMAQEFYGHLSETRPNIDSKDMQGQIFQAKEALERGFIDGIVNGIEDVIALL